MELTEQHITGLLKAIVEQESRESLYITNRIISRLEDISSEMIKNVSMTDDKLFFIASYYDYDEETKMELFKHDLPSDVIKYLANNLEAICFHSLGGFVDKYESYGWNFIHIYDFFVDFKFKDNSQNKRMLFHIEHDICEDGTTKATVTLIENQPKLNASQNVVFQRTFKEKPLQFLFYPENTVCYKDKVYTSLDEFFEQINGV